MQSTETTAAPTIAKRSKPPFRADHVGSLLRPPGLLRAREALADRPEGMSVTALTRKRV